MAATYTMSDSSLDQVRFLIQDTDTTAAEFDDVEITKVITAKGGVYPAALHLVDILILKYARKPSTRIGSISVGAEVVKQLKEARQSIVTQMVGASASAGGSPLHVGGHTVAEATTEAADTTLTQPVFTRNQHNYPGTE